MPQARPTPSEIAAEAKRTYIPYIDQQFPQYPARSHLHPDSSTICVDPDKSPGKRTRIAVIDGDPVDVALDWYEYNNRPGSSSTDNSGSLEQARIPLVNMANEKRAGGDWESGLLAPEERLARRSNLVRALITPWTQSTRVPNYPIPTAGGIYSPNVGVCTL